jgi:hypothetical protein
LIILIILSEEYKLWSSSPNSCHFISPIQIFSSALYSRTPSVCVPPLMSRDQVSRPMEPQAKSLG